MKIPLKYQLFDGPPVEISDKDRERLIPHLVSSGHLNEMFLLGVNEVDLKRLVVLELVGTKRRPILVRLLGRVSSIQRRAILARLDSCLQKNP